VTCNVAATFSSQDDACHDDHHSSDTHPPFVGTLGKSRSVSLAVLVSISACGPAELAAQGATDESTGEPDEPPEPACQFEWEWRKRIDDFTQLPNLHAMDVDEAGNVYAVGSIGGGLGASDPPFYESDIWVASWRSDGTQAWVRTFGEPGQVDYGSSLQVGRYGGLFVLGSMSGGDSWGSVARTPRPRDAL
jgi:hypothetical protein